MDELPASIPVETAAQVAALIQATNVARHNQRVAEAALAAATAKAQDTSRQAPHANEDGVMQKRADEVEKKKRVRKWRRCRRAIADAIMNRTSNAKCTTNDTHNTTEHNIRYYGITLHSAYREPPTTDVGCYRCTFRRNETRR